jgi:hypothetical protein
MNSERSGGWVYMMAMMADRYRGAMSTGVTAHLQRG